MLKMLQKKNKVIKDIQNAHAANIISISLLQRG